MRTELHQMAALCRCDFLAIFAMLALLLMPGAAWGAGSMAPLWLRVMPQVEGRVYGIGVAAIATTQAAALELAGHSARFEILAQLRSSVRGQAVFQTEMTSQQSHVDQGTALRRQRAEINGEVTVAETSLPGIALEETYLDQETRTAYVLAYLDAKVARRDCEFAWQRLERTSLAAASTPPARSPVDSFISLRRLKKQADALLEQVTLLRPFFADEELCGKALALQQHLTTAAETARQQASCGLDPRSPAPQEINQMIRIQVEQAGCVWSDTAPAILIAARIETSEHRVGFYPRDFHVRRMTALVTVRGADGTHYDSFSLAVKGIGTDTFTAKQVLKQNFAETFRENIRAGKSGLFDGTAPGAITMDTN